MSDCRCSVVAGAGYVHCRSCCTTFQSVTLFDLHRVGPVDSRECTLFPTTDDAYFLGSGQQRVVVYFYPEQNLWGTEGYQAVLDKVDRARVARQMNRAA